MSEARRSLTEGYRLHHFATIGSTNDEAKAFARAGAPAGTVVSADMQRAGRGRRGREWVSPPGNLYLTLVQRPDGSAPRAAQLGFVAALGLADALIDLTGSAAAVRLKWPNDVLFNGRKLAGILLESETGAGGGVEFVVVGIGVNIAVAPSGTEYPATSLIAEGVTAVTPGALLQAFIGAFDAWARCWRERGFAPVRLAWLARAGGLGEAIRVRLEGSTLDGCFLDLDADGALVLGAAEGPRRITAGAVFPAA